MVFPLVSAPIPFYMSVGRISGIKYLHSSVSLFANVTLFDVFSSNLHVKKSINFPIFGVFTTTHYTYHARIIGQIVEKMAGELMIKQAPNRSG